MRRATTSSTRDLRQKLHVTQPPRMEAKVKNAMMDPVKKKKKVVPKTIEHSKRQGFTEVERKAYHLASKRKK